MADKVFTVTRKLSVALSLAAILCSPALLGQSVRAQAVSQIQPPGPSLSLLPVVTYSTGEPGVILWGESNTVAISDVNGDGHPDLLMAAYCMACAHGQGTGKVSVLLNNGDGTFQPALIYSTGGFFSIAVLVADINSDSKPDLIVANGCTMEPYFCPDEGSVGILLGNGDGTFQPVQIGLAGGVPFALAVADVSKDGRLDVIVANAGVGNSGEGSVGVLLGTGTGVLQPVRVYDSGGMQANFVVVSDVNDDGKPDVLVSNTQQCQNCIPTLGVLVGNGDGTLKPVVTYAGVGAASGLVVSDMNGDGLLDVILNEGGIFYGGIFSVLVGNGDGTFQPEVMYATGGGYNFLPVVADLNGDQKLDVIAPVLGGCPGFPNGHGCVSVLFGNGDGTLQSPVFHSASSGAGWVAVNDLNGDSIPDIAFVGAGSFLGVLQGNGDGTFQPAQFYRTGGYDYSTWVGVADLNGDGEPDLVVENPNQNRSRASLGVFLNNSARRTPTSTGLTSSPNPTTYGQAVSFVARVTSDSGTPTGTVQILDGSAVVGSGTLSSGSVSIPVSSLPVGAESITGFYLGGGGFAPSKSTPLIQTVTRAATATSLASSLNPAGTNQSITFTAAVSSQYGGAASGTVTFMAGAQNLGSASLSGNVASLTASFATTGTYSITAVYSGDSNNIGSTSGALSQKIVASSTTALTSSLNPSVVGQAVTFVAAVTSSAGIPPNGETITFYNGTAVLGTAPLTTGAATLTTSALPTGVFTITARYPGDSNFAASTSAGLRQTVNATSKSATATTLASSLNPSIYGQKVILTAQVTTSGPMPPVGAVVFMWKYFTQTYTIGTAPLNSAGVATLTKSNLNAGQYPMIAVYRGDTNNLGSTSPMLNQTVLQTTTKATITSSPSPSTQGQAVTFAASITSPTVMPTGPVTFMAGSTTLSSVRLSGGTASFTTSSLPPGSTVVKVKYGGNSNIKRSSAALTQVVQP